MACRSFAACAHYARIWTGMCLWSNNLSWRNWLYSRDVSEVPGSLALRKKIQKMTNLIKNYGTTISNRIVSNRITKSYHTWSIKSKNF